MSEEQLTLGIRRESPRTRAFPQRPRVAPLVEIEGRREIPVRVDLRLQVGDLLLRGDNSVGAGDKSARRWFLARNGDERSRELRWVAGLLARTESSSRNPSRKNSAATRQSFLPASLQNAQSGSSPALSGLCELVADLGIVQNPFPPRPKTLKKSHE